MKKIWALLSWRNWGIIRYNSIWQNIAALFYIALKEQLFTIAFLGQAGLFFLFSTMMTGYGYLINDLADIELDRRHGKPNVFHKIGPGRAIGIVLGVLVIGAVFGLPFISRPGFGLMWLLWLGAATFYSLPPLRLKEHGLSGLAATIMAQQTLPTALLLAAFGVLTSWGALIFILFSTVRGISSDVSHQMRDWSNDVSTGTPTFAVRYGYKTTQTVYAISLEVERLILGGVLGLLLLDLPPIIIPGLARPVALAWPLLLLYAPLFLLTVGRSWRALCGGQLAAEDPYSEERQARRWDVLHIIHHPLPSVVMPLYLAVWLTIFYWPHVLFLFVLSWLYKLYSPARWLKIWPLRPLLAWLRVIKT
jgi:4-hydroxybenzoate polyprenyltransferase